jgi:hypothetical protein
MTQERWQRLEELFPQALGLYPDERASFIAQRCSGDPELKLELERLLALDDQAERNQFLGPSPTASHAGFSSAIAPEGSDGAVAPEAGAPTAKPSYAIVGMICRIGKYEVVRWLGDGSQGSAVLARDPDLQTLVVLKIYHAPEDHEALLREGRALARVRHPNVARCLGLERIGTLLVLVVEYIPGRDLSTHWREKPGTYRAAARVVECLAAGLGAVHGCGLLHRDIKPANVLLGDDGEPRLVDFGLAIAHGSNTGGVRSGSPAYMAPEQARGEWERVDPRTDVFGLGATLYTLLTGRPPYKAETSLGTLRLAETCQFPNPRQLCPAIPRALERICLRAMSPAPERRYASAAELEHALRHWRRSPLRHAVASAGVVVLLGLAPIGMAYHHSGPSAAAPVALAAPPQATPLKILRLDVEHLAKRGEAEFEPRGNLGEESFQVASGDDVRLRGVLSAPAYSFLIAFRPDGVVEVCDPDDPDLPPAISTQVRYPPRSKPQAVYRLEDGTGLQAFALIASRAPLPSFREWQKRNGAPPWKAGLAGSVGVVWQHDGEWLEPRSPSPAGRQRGQGKTIRDGLPVATLADWLKAIDGIDAVEVVAFPVSPGGH